jgi:hypothetical protein
MKRNCQNKPHDKIELTLSLVEISISVRGLEIVAVVAWIPPTQTDRNAYETGEDDEETTDCYEDDPRELHAKYQIFCWI